MKQTKKKPAIAGGKAIDNSRNNNPQMVADLMGDGDDYGDEYGDYGDYGDEAGASGNNAKREPETAFDFMWKCSSKSVA